MEGEAALELLDGVTELLVARGRTKIVRVDLAQERPDDDTLLGLMLGRSGKLRAPTLRSGTRLFVGYNAEMMQELLD